MKANPILRRTLGVLVVGLTLSASAVAEPPSRAARLSELDGTVSFSPAGHPDWVRAAANRPLTTGDRLWTAARSRAELQIGGAAMRIGPSSSVTLLRLDNRLVQLQLTQGVLRLRVRSLGPRQYFEIATPNLALTVRRPGDYRIEVDPADNATTVLVRSGDAEVYGEGASYRVDARRGYRFYDTGLVDYDVLTAQRDDDFDRWSRQRDGFVERSVSARYVSTDVVGYADLDAHGNWRSVRGYGYVWAPNRVPAGWSPYRDGHWAWVDPWGWTWIDDAPWGYAVSHYGRWAHLDGRWVWVPGPRAERAVYAPALVAFIGGSNFQVSITGGSANTGAVGWFPLAPREVYQPSYAVSREYFSSINRSNAVIAPQVITQVYNTSIVNNNTTIIVNNNTAAGGAPVGYANRQVSGAVVAVPTQAFVQSQPVARASVQVPREAAVSAPVARVAAVAPVAQSVQGGREAAARPPTREQRVVARTELPPPPVAFAAQAKQLAAAPGRPIDEASRAQLAPAPAAAAAPKVSVVASPAPAAAALPPPPAATDRAVRRAARAPAVEAAAPAAPTDSAQPGAAPTERQGAAARRQAERAEAAPPNAAGSSADAAQAAQAEAAKAAAAKERAAKAEEAKADTTKAQAAKAEAARDDAVKAEAAKVQAARAEEAKAEAAKSEAARAAAVKAQATKAEEAKADAAQAQAAKAEAARADAVKAETNRGQAAKAEQARAEANKAQAARAEEAKAEAVKADATKAEAGKAAVAKAQADKAEEARADAAKAQAARAEAARADASKAEAAKAQAAKADEARAEAVKAQAARADAAKAEAAKAEAALAATARGDAVALREQRRGEAASAAGARASGPRSAADGDDGKKRGRDEPGKR